MVSSRWFVLVLLSSSLELSWGLISIQVCQNKNCCKNFKGTSNLVETLNDMLLVSSTLDNDDDTIVIEKSGCLDQCSYGPNVKVSVQKDGEKEDFQLQELSDVSKVVDEMRKFVTVPTVLLAAVRVMEKTEKESTPEGKLRYLNSVIQKLESEEVQMKDSAANLHAYCLRAQVHYGQQDYEQAKHDAMEAVSISQRSSMTFSPRNAWRILADIEEAAQNISAAIEAFQHWADADPTFQSKIHVEIQRLQALQERADDSIHPLKDDQLVKVKSSKPKFNFGFLGFEP